MKMERRRDNQQWLLDHMVKTTGRVINFAYDNRVVPPEVKSYAMIPRVMEKRARHKETLGLAAEAAGHTVTARELFWHASEEYREAQHSIFEDDNQEKIYLHGKMLECFGKVMKYADHTIELVEIPFEDNYIQGVLHLVPGAKKAPTVLFIPGMDMTKEAVLDPIHHPFVMRGLNCLHIDGPGQGTSNIRKIRVTADNYPRAGKAAIDFLSKRKEVDPERIGVSGFSFGSYWGTELAAMDSRVKAVATGAACYGPKYAIFEQASPRFKQVFMYMAGIHDEAKFDKAFEGMTLDKLAPKVKCPSLLVVGEYDPLAPLDDVLKIYEKIPAPRELWVCENDFHVPRGTENFGLTSFYGFLADWINDVFAGKKGKDLDQIVLVKQMEGPGPYAKPIEGVLLPERLGKGSKGLSAAQKGPSGVKGK